MDMLSMVSGLLAAQAGNVQMQVATAIMKSNADAEKSAVLTLLGVAQQSTSSPPILPPALAAISISRLNSVFRHSGAGASANPESRAENLRIPGSLVSLAPRNDEI